MNFENFKAQADLISARYGNIGDNLTSLKPPLTSLIVHKLEQYKIEIEKKIDIFEKLSERFLDQTKLPDDYAAEEMKEILNRVPNAHARIIAQINDLIPDATPPSPGISNPNQSLSFAQNSVLRLPRIKLPEFDGDPAKWTHFYNFFDTAVHKTDLPPIEKFSHLNSCLKGEPLKIATGVPMSSANYQIAWESLIKVYQDTRRLTSLHLGKLLDLPPLNKSDAKSLRSFLFSLSENKRALALLEYEIEDNNLLLVATILRKMDDQLRTRFEDKYTEKEHPLLSHIESFLERECHKLETSAYIAKDSNPKPVTTKPAYTPPYRNSNFQKSSYSHLATSDSQNLRKCIFCESNDHKIYHCDQFKILSPNERHAFIKDKGYCTNCLGTKHTYRACETSNRCSKCNLKHHSLLHFQSNSTSTAVNSTHEVKDQQKRTALSCQISQPHNVILGTALVRIKTADKRFIVARAVIDFGSQVSIITTQLFNSLKLPLVPNQLDIAGLAGNKTTSHGLVELNIVPRFCTKPAVHLSTVVMDTITSPLPSTDLPIGLKEAYQGIDLADPEFHISSDIDLLLGADVAPQVFRNGLLNFPAKPSCFNSIFGWVIIGPAPSDPPSACATSLFTSAASSQNLDSLLRRIWDLEETPAPKCTSPDDKFCEEYFKETTYRDPTGRYVVSLPFAKPPEELSTNRDTSLRRYYSLERRFDHEPDLKLEYNSFFEEYLTLDHMSVAKSPSKYVIPHHPVVKTSSSTTKVRAVFDGSNEGRNGQSLNALLHKGPNMLKNITEIIFNFRKFKFILCADIKMMYRQILLHPDHRKFQHIFWRPNQNSPVIEFELNTVTYGLGPSAFLSQRVLTQLAHDDGADFPLAAQAILENTYVDNFATGADNMEDASLLLTQLLGLLPRGGFILRKWYSNAPELLKDISENDLEKSSTIEFADEEMFLVLGLRWLAESDSFTYSNDSFPEDTPVTKRNALIYLARIFDPLQWLAPITLWIKHFIQTLWKLGYDWDDKASPDLETTWRNFVAEFPALTRVRIPRYIPILNSSTHLVGFADASVIGYGCIIYLVTCSDNQTPNSIHIIASKAKPSPMKVVSIPRLELCAAHLLANLFNSLYAYLSQFQLNIIRLHSDSATVLRWLRKPAYELKTFVANRTTQILEMSQPEHWYYIESEINPAGILSRGSSPQTLINNSLWWDGPDFLKQAPDSWPNNPLPPLKEELPEVKTVSLSVTRTPQPKNDLINLIKAQNSYPKLVRIVAFMKRFIVRISPKTNSSFPVSLSVSEMNKASLSIIKVVQQHHFNDEFALLEKDNQCSQKLRPLAPFIDSSGFLRVGGRLRHSPLQYDSKFPLLIPRESHLATLLVNYFHLITIHGGLTLTQHLLQRKFWIVGARSLIKKCIFRCSICYLFKATPLQPKMADLPPCRFSQVRAFHKVGVDFAGPYQIKEHTRRNARSHKGYLCIFVCLSTKAVHLEIATEMSTQNFIDAFDRFIARRGLPISMHSDCGTNFKGCANKLKQLYEFLTNSNDSFHIHLAARQIEWIFNPPASPNFGGLWEAAVKSCKHHLVRAMDTHPLTYEEFSTLTCKIEATLNSRPLCIVSSDPNDDSDYLTPGHFIIGSPLLELPQEDLLKVPPNRLKRWQWIRQCHQTTWKRWSNEYLQQLTRRNKWTNPSPSLKVGDVVRVLGIKTSPLLWPLGRVLELIHGKDGIARSAKIKVLGTELHRPVSKLVPLPPNIPE